MQFCVPVIGDAHLRNDGRQPDREAALRQIVRECMARPTPIGLWGVPGDLHDAGSDVFTRNLWAELLLEMADVAPVVTCYGNHDRDGDLDIYGKLKGRHPIYVVRQPTVITVPEYERHGVPRVSVCVLPYPHPAGLVANGTAPGDVVASAAQLLDNIFMMLGAQLQQAREAGLPTLFLFHANISGSRSSTGQPLVGQEMELTESMLMRLGDCPKIGNHIHLPQEICGAWEVGSICRLSFGEMEEKRYVVVNYEQKPVLTENEGGLSHGSRWVWQVASHPIAVAAMAHVNAVFNAQDPVEMFRYDVQPSDVPAGADVRVRVEYHEAERKFFELGRPAMEAVFGHARRLQIEPVCLAHDRGLRAPEVLAEKTTPGKLRAWCAANGLPIPEGLDDAVAALETQDGDALITDFRAKMNALLEETDAARVAG